jgi:hypothetical protein
VMRLAIRLREGIGHQSLQLVTEAAGGFLRHLAGNQDHAVIPPGREKAHASWILSRILPTASSAN